MKELSAGTRTVSSAFLFIYFSVKQKTWWEENVFFIVKTAMKHYFVYVKNKYNSVNLF